MLRARAQLAPPPSTRTACAAGRFSCSNPLDVRGRPDGTPWRGNVTTLAVASAGLRDRIQAAHDLVRVADEGGVVEDRVEVEVVAGGIGREERAHRHPLVKGLLGEALDDAVGVV